MSTKEETSLFAILGGVAGGGIGVIWTIWALFGGEYEGSVPIFGVAIVGALIGGLVGAGIDWMVNRFSLRPRVGALRLLGGLLLACAVILLLVPVPVVPGGASCGSALFRLHPGTRCDPPINRQRTEVLVIGAIGGGVIALARKSARNPPPPQRPPSGPPDLDATTVSRNPSNRPTGVIGCSGCGKEVSEGAQFCPHCGKRFEDPPCANPDCDAIPSESERFCSKCGWPIQIQSTDSWPETHPSDAGRDLGPPWKRLWWIGVVLVWVVVLLYVIDVAGIIDGEAFSAFRDSLPWNWDW